MLDAEPSSPARSRRQVLLRAVAAAVALTLAACTPEPPLEDPPEGEDPSLSLGLGQAVLNLIRGASTTLEVEVTRDGAPAGDVTLAVEGTLPAGISVTFDPPTLGPNETTSLLTVAADAAAQNGAFGLVVAAEAADVGNGSAEADATLVVDVAGLTVQGRVRDVFGRVLRDILVGSQGQLDLSGPDGSFVLKDLSVPYDLMMVRRDIPALHEYEGLTASDPDLVIFQAITSPASLGSATVTGTVAGGAPLAAGEVVFVCAEGIDAVVYGCDQVGAGADTYELDLFWHTYTDQEIKLHAFLALVAADETVTEFLGYTVASGTIADGDVVTRDLNFGPIDTKTLTGSLERAGGGPNPDDPIVFAAVRFSDRLSMVVSGRPATGSYSIPVPSPPGGSWQYDVMVGDGLFSSDRISATWRTATGLDAGHVELDDLPSLVRPANGTAGLELDAEFEVAGLDGLAKTFSWYYEDSTPVTFSLTTTADVASVPDPGQVGLAAEPPAGEYDWEVVSSGATSVDEEARLMPAVLSAALSLYGRVGGAPIAGGSLVNAYGSEIELGTPPPPP